MDLELIKTSAVEVRKRSQLNSLTGRGAERCHLQFTIYVLRWSTEGAVGQCPGGSVTSNEGSYQLDVIDGTIANPVCTPVSTRIPVEAGGDAS